MFSCKLLDEQFPGKWQGKIIFRYRGGRTEMSCIFVFKVNLFIFYIKIFPVKNQLM